MSAVKMFGIRCDRCGVVFETEAPTGAAARRLARDEQWTHPRANLRSRMRIDLCPGCSEETAA